MPVTAGTSTVGWSGFLARYWVALGFPGAAPLFVGGVAFLKGLVWLWLSYIKHILTCCTVNH